MNLVLLTSVLLIAANFIGCRTVNSVSSSDTQHFSTHRDSIILHDSIFVREYVRGDTVYVDRVRDRWKEKLLVRTDTLVRCDTLVQHISTPATIPRYYKRISLAFWLLFIFLILLLFIRLFKRFYLKG